MAFRDGDPGIEGEVGAVLLAEGLDHLRICAEVLAAYAKGMSRRRG